MRAIRVLPSSGGVASPWPTLADHSARSASVVRVVFSRKSSRTVVKRKISTARRTGRTRSAASDGLFASASACSMILRSRISSSALA